MNFSQLLKYYLGLSFLISLNACSSLVPNCSVKHIEELNHEVIPLKYSHRGNNNDDEEETDEEKKYDYDIRPGFVHNDTVTQCPTDEEIKSAVNKYHARIRDLEKQREENEAWERENEAQRVRVRETWNKLMQDPKIIESCGNQGDLLKSNLSNNPYSDLGKCEVHVIRPYALPPARHQWLSADKMLVIPALTGAGNSEATFIYMTDDGSALPLGRYLVVKRVEPEQYTNGFGTLETPFTYAIVKALPEGTIQPY